MHFSFSRFSMIFHDAGNPVAKQGDNRFGSVHLSACMHSHDCVEQSISDHYQSDRFACVSVIWGCLQKVSHCGRWVFNECISTLIATDTCLSIVQTEELGQTDSQTRTQTGGHYKVHNLPALLKVRGR